VPRAVSRRDGVAYALPAPLGSILHLARELPAGGVDVLATRLANRRHEPGILKHALEGEDRAARAGPEFSVGEGIERDQIELARHLAYQRDELARLRRRVVDAVKHYVFESDEITRCALDVAHARGEQLRERMLAVDRYEAVAQRIIRRVQRNRERDRAFVAQPVDPWHEARG